jgi:hypothetical protein
MQIGVSWSWRVGKGRLDMEYVETALYPTLGGTQALLRPLLRLVDRPSLIASCFAPLLIVKITRLTEE